MSTKLKNLEDLFQEQIKDLYSAEKQIIAALPKMAKAATNTKLKKAFEDHLEETKEQKIRLEKIGEILKFKIDGEVCEATKGLVEEGKDMIEINAEDEVRDAGLIACAQRIEHYEISGYGTAHHYAEKLGFKEAMKLLAETLKEEQKADTSLNDLAKSKINKEAMA